jgi:hypothetical protein
MGKVPFGQYRRATRHPHLFHQPDDILGRFETVSFDPNQNDRVVSAIKTLRGFTDGFIDLVPVLMRMGKLAIPIDNLIWNGDLLFDRIAMHLEIAWLLIEPDRTNNFVDVLGRI